MSIVVIALLPAMLFGMYNIGYQNAVLAGKLSEATFWGMFFYGFLELLPNILVSYIVGLGIEFAWAQWKHEEIQEGYLVTGILIPLITPVTIPQFGYEKSFYVEENFYYSANDCEDRAVLLAFLVRNLLHLDVHLLYYPGHEATAIRFSDQSIKGDGYVYQDGSKYIICDPTYIGAGVGQCMPEYENVKPKVELW